MEDFYDLNELFAAFLRKWRFIIALIVIGGVLFGGYRGINMVKAYNSQEQEPKPKIEEESAEGEPMWITETNTLMIRPDYEMINGEIVDNSEQIAQAFRSNKDSKSVMEKLAAEFFDQEAALDKERKSLLNKYGYILDKEVDFPYALFDFTSQCYIDNQNNTLNYVTLGFRSTDAKLAREISDRYCELMIENMQKLLGDFEYEYLDKGAFYTLPTRTEGTSTTRVISGAAVNDGITKNTIVKQTIKGGIWGGGLGAFFAVACVFFLYFVNSKVVKYKDIAAYGKTVFGICYVKKHGRFLTWINKKIQRLEGSGNVLYDISDLAAIIGTYVKTKGIQGEIIVGSSQNDKEVDKLVDALNNRFGSENKYNKGIGIGTNPDTIKMAGQINDVIIVEFYNGSTKKSVLQEIEYFEEFGCNILGIAGLEK